MASLDEEVKKQLKDVENVLVSIDDLFGNLEEVDYEETSSVMTPVEKARYNITIAYAVNSLFWMYLRSMGEDPQTHKVKDELDRIKSQMQRLQQINDKSKRPKVDTIAASRMIRHGINEYKNNRKRKSGGADENWEEDLQQQQSSASSGGGSKEDRGGGGGGGTSQKKQK